jgi:hypothetical protein
MIARVFPRKTKATPDDSLVFFTAPQAGGIPDITEVHVSVAFTWDIPKAEQLAEAWRVTGVPVHLGGPAYSAPGDEFVPGRYLKLGNVITSRGCPNRCWFCPVPKREGNVLRELQIHDGWNVRDDNLLACSDKHIKAVFEMLSRQSKKPVFSGGLEAKLLKPWHAEELRKLHPYGMYFAYDTPDDFEPLVQAGKTLQNAGFRLGSHMINCYVLIGYRGDTFEKAEARMHQTIHAGFMPFAMLYRDDRGDRDPKWMTYQRTWANPIIVGKKVEQIRKAGVESGS